MLTLLTFTALALIAPVVALARGAAALGRYVEADMPDTPDIEESNWRHRRAA